MCTTTEHSECGIKKKLWKHSFYGNLNNSKIHFKIYSIVWSKKGMNNVRA